MKNGKLTIEIRQRSTSDDEWVKAVLKKYWYSTRIISKGRIHEADKLPGFIAQQNNIRVGLILYEIIGNECENTAYRDCQVHSGESSVSTGLAYNDKR